MRAFRTCHRLNSDSTRANVRLLLPGIGTAQYGELESIMQIAIPAFAR
jgi:hypothetical protein